MPLYGYRCRACGHAVEVIGTLAEREELMRRRELGVKEQQLAKEGLLPLCGECQGVMHPEHGSFSINFRTWGGNTYGFSSNRPAKGTKRPAVIGRGHGLGGHRGRRNPTSRDVGLTGGKEYK